MCLNLISNIWTCKLKLKKKTFFVHTLMFMITQKLNSAPKTIYINNFALYSFKTTNLHNLENKLTYFFYYIYFGNVYQINSQFSVIVTHG